MSLPRNLARLWPPAATSLPSSFWCPRVLFVSPSFSHILPMSAHSLINVNLLRGQQGRHSSAAPSVFIHPIVLVGGGARFRCPKTANVAHKRDETKNGKNQRGWGGGRKKNLKKITEMKTRRHFPTQSTRINNSGNDNLNYSYIYENIH